MLVVNHVYMGLAACHILKLLETTAAVMKEAHSYLVKSVGIEELLNIVRDRSRKQEEAKKYSEEKVAEFIETRVKELEEEKTMTYKKVR